jgi:hypothetical protein
MISRPFRVGLHSQRVTIAGFTLVRRTGSQEMAAFERLRNSTAPAFPGRSYVVFVATQELPIVDWLSSKGFYRLSKPCSIGCLNDDSHRLRRR